MLKKNPNWNLIYENWNSIITKWADDSYLIDDLNENMWKILFESYKSNDFENIIKNKDFDEIIKKLINAWVFVFYDKKIEKSSNLNFSIKWIWDKNENIENKLFEFLKESDNISLKEWNEDIILIIRTNSQLKEILKDYENIKKTHILIDIWYDHNISIWPLVFPWKTACLWCFIWKITQNWWDIEPPLVPNITENYELITWYIKKFLNDFSNIWTCPNFIENAWSFNFETLESKIDKVYKLPWCPHCNNDIENWKKKTINLFNN